MRLGRYEVAVEERSGLSPAYSLLSAVAAIVLALILSSFLFRSPEASLLDAYRAVFTYAFVNPHGLGATVHRSIFLLLCTYAFLVPLRAGLWNIGLPGQMYAGGLAAFGVAFVLGTAETAPAGAAAGLIILGMALAAGAAGGLIGGLAGFLRARLNVNEILVTMMLNSILFWLVAYMIKEGGAFMSATGEGESFRLPGTLQGPMVAGIPLTAAAALAAAVLLDWLFARTALGYRIRALGENPQAARYGGIVPLALSLLVFTLGGAFAGFAGYHYFTAIPGVYKIPGNYGYYGDLAFYGIISALIARGSSLGAVPIAVLFAGLSLGARFAQGALRLPFGVDYALLGLLMMTFIGSHAAVRFRLTARRIRPAPGRRVPADAAET